MIKRYKESEIKEVIDILKKDGVISVPTDTVYGLCARISSVIAYNNLMMVKNRPSTKRFPIMCANEEQIKDIAIVDEKAEKIIKAFMPGPITLILRKKAELPEYINNGGDTIAIRMATSNILKEIILALGTPVFMTSANQSGKEVCTSLDEIEIQCPKLNGMLDGKVTFGKSSTIIDCSLSDIKILREGPITLQQIEEVLED